MNYRLMFSKGKSTPTEFQSMVECRADSILSLITIIPKYINDMSSLIEKECEDSAEYEEVWDDEIKDYVKAKWYPNGYYYDPEIFEDMLIDFYASLVQRIYSFCEIGLLELCKNKEEAQKEWLQYLESNSNEKMSNVVFYYKLLQKQFSIELPGIKKIWKLFREFHDVRVEITHKDLRKELCAEFIINNINEVREFLLKTEKSIVEHNIKTNH